VALGLCLWLAVLSVESSLVTSSTIDVKELGEAGQLGLRATEGGNGAKWWRIRAGSKTVGGQDGDEWSVSEWSIHADAAGTTEDLVQPELLYASSEWSACKPEEIAKGCTSDHKPVKVADADPETYWRASSVSKNEYLGIQFNSATEVRSMKIRLFNPTGGINSMAPNVLAIEKSADGEAWAPVDIITDLKSWGTTSQLYTWTREDEVPSSTFTIRSQEQPGLCIGIKPRYEPDDVEQKRPIKIETDALIEIQDCVFGERAQNFALHSDGTLHSALNEEFILHFVAGEPKAASELSVKRCVEGCADLKAQDKFVYEGGAEGGGLWRSDVAGKQNIVFAPKDSDLTAGTPLSAIACGMPDSSALISACQSSTMARWEMSPMFKMEESKRLINCAPYSHSTASPAHCTTREEAQKLCAADAECVAYNWAGEDPAGEGAVANQVFLCHDMHELHNDMTGWELGVKLSLIEKFG